MSEERDGAEEAKARVERFLAVGQREFVNNMEFTLRAIAALPTWKAWRAPQMAEEALGIGLYWSKELPPGRNVSPKSLPAYYVRTFVRWLRWRRS